MRTGILAKALLPYLLVQVLVIAAVLIAPAMVHLLDGPVAASGGAPVSEQDIVRQMEDMARQLPPGDEPQTPAGTEAPRGPTAK